MIKSITRSNRWWDLPAALLLAVVLTISFSRLLATEWTEGLRIIYIIVYVGLLAGFALGYSQFSPRRVTFFAVAYGLFVIIWQLGTLLGHGILWTERIQSLGGRLGEIIGQLYQQQAVSDNLLFLTLMAILFWALSIYAGYSFTRHGNPWRIVIPVGIVLVLIHSYDALLDSRTWYLVIFIFFSLMFVARLVYVRQRNQWKDNNTYMPPYLAIDFIRLTVVTIIVLLIFAWAVPGLAKALPAAQDAWRQVKQPWSQVRNTFDNAFASLRSTVGIVTDYYGPNLSLGRGNRMSDSQIFSVITPTDPPDGTRFYWRARVYDTYENGWRSNFLTDETVNSENFDLNFPDTSDDVTDPSTFSFTTGSHIATLLTAHQPVWVSRPAKLELTYNPDGTADVGLIRADPPLRAGETYTVRSSLNQVTIADLRNAGTDYPDWVRSKYLQIPENITPRTIELAQRIALGEETPYDIATAMTRYLRTNIEYSETVPPLPNDQELIDWFLFDIKQGFCNYYATAEVIMLRSLGIPARLGVGYAQGEPIEGVPDAFNVRQRDAHAWPEVYFPGIGWVEFEPTASQPRLSRPVGEVNDQDSGSPLNNNFNNLGNDSFREDPFEERREEEAISAGSESLATSPSILAISAGILLVIILLSIPLLRRKNLQDKFSRLPSMVERGFQRVGLKPPAFLSHWAQYSRLGPLSRAYTQINMALNRLGTPPSTTQTPAERATLLTNILPESANPADRLIGEYQAQTYSQNYKANIDNARTAGVEIRNLSIKAVLQRTWERFSSRFKGRNRTY